MQLITESNLDGRLLTCHELNWIREKAGFKLTIQNLVTLLTSRIELENTKPYDDFDPLPHDFSIRGWCEFDSTDKDEVAAFENLCRLSLSDGYIAKYRIRRMIAYLNPNGDQVAQFITHSVLKDSNRDILYSLASLASAYNDHTAEWELGAEPILNAAQHLNRKDRERIYFGLSRKESGVLTSMPGEVAKHYPNRCEVADRISKEKKPDSPLSGYWNWALKSATADYERELARTEEDSND
jgi:hypothetical protein